MGDIGCYADYAFVADHAEVAALIRKDPRTALSFRYAVTYLIWKDRAPEAVETARRSLKLADRLSPRYRGELQFGLALALSHTAEADPLRREEAYNALRDAGKLLGPSQVNRLAAEQNTLADLIATFGPVR